MLAVGAWELLALEVASVFRPKRSIRYQRTRYMFCVLMRQSDCAPQERTIRSSRWPTLFGSSRTLIAGCVAVKALPVTRGVDQLTKLLSAESQTSRSRVTYLLPNREPHDRSGNRFAVQKSLAQW